MAGVDYPGQTVSKDDRQKLKFAFNKYFTEEENALSKGSEYRAVGGKGKENTQVELTVSSFTSSTGQREDQLGNEI